MYALCMSVRVFVRRDVPFIWNDDSRCIMLAVCSVCLCKYELYVCCVRLQAALSCATLFDGRKFIFCTSSAHFISGSDSAGTKVYIRKLQRTWKAASSRSTAKIVYGVQRSLLSAGPCRDHYWALGRALFELNIIHILTCSVLRFRFMLTFRTYLGIPIYLLFSPKGHESFS